MSLTCMTIFKLKLRRQLKIWSYLLPLKFIIIWLRVICSYSGPKYCHSNFKSIKHMYLKLSSILKQDSSCWISLVYSNSSLQPFFPIRAFLGIVQRIVHSRTVQMLYSTSTGMNPQVSFDNLESTACWSSICLPNFSSTNDEVSNAAKWLFTPICLHCHQD
jgi:hypothetical protein